MSSCIILFSLNERVTLLYANITECSVVYYMGVMGLNEDRILYCITFRFIILGIFGENCVFLGNFVYLRFFWCFLKKLFSFFWNIFHVNHEWILMKNVCGILQLCYFGILRYEESQIWWVGKELLLFRNEENLSKVGKLFN